MMRLLLRADGGLRIGTGHIMRCLALADELRTRGGACTFAMRAMQGDLIDEVHMRGHEVIAMSAGDEPGEAGLTAWLEQRRQPASQLSDAQELASALPVGEHFDWVVTDHYALGAAWQAAMRPHARRVLVIDDLADRSHDGDVLLDQNPQRPGRYDGKAQGALLLAGPRYALLRPEFLVARSQLHRAATAGRALHALVSFGGADEQGVALQALAALAQSGFGAGQVTVVAGGRNPHLAALDAACRTQGWQCLASTSAMAALMAQADLGIGAGGTSMIERFAMALPCVVVPIADNQRPGGREAHRLGAVSFVDVPDAERVPAIAAALTELIAAPQALERMSQAAGALCDAHGTGRVAATLQRLALVLTPAQASDATRLHEWRNHEATRRHSGNGAVIALDAHLRWFNAVLDDPHRGIWIASLQGEPVGVVRLDTRQEAGGRTAVISVYRVPAGGVEGRGWGSAVIAAGVTRAREHWPDLTRVDARISPDNEASLRAFAACGFTPGHEEGLYCSYLRSALP